MNGVLVMTYVVGLLSVLIGLYWLLFPRKEDDRPPLSAYVMIILGGALIVMGAYEAKRDAKPPLAPQEKTQNP